MAWPAVTAARPRPWWTLTLKYVVLGYGCLLAARRRAHGRDMVTSGMTRVPTVVTGAQLRAAARAGR